MTDLYPDGSGPADSISEENVHVLADWPHRATAFLIDLFILFLVAKLPSIVLGDGAFITALERLAAAGIGIWMLVLQGRTGQSPGKRAMGIKLVGTSDAEPIGALRSVVRSFAHIVDMYSMVGFMWPMWDKNRQTFADKIMKTVVVILPTASAKDDRVTDGGELVKNDDSGIMHQ